MKTPIRMKPENTLTIKKIGDEYHAHIPYTKISFAFISMLAAENFCKTTNEKITCGDLFIYGGILKATPRKKNLSTLLTLTITRNKDGVKKIESKDFPNTITGNKECFKFMDETQKEHANKEQGNSSLEIEITQS